MRGPLFRQRFVTLTGVALIAAGSIVAAQSLGTTSSSTATSTTTPVPDVQAKASANDLSRAFRQAAEQVLPSVVSIETRSAVADAGRQVAPRGERSFGSNPFENSPFEEFFQQPEFRQFQRRFQAPVIPNSTAAGLGSGVIIDDAGIILTNNHVVAGGGEVMVRLSDGREFVATDVKTDPKTDLAVVRIEGAEDLVAAHLGDSDRMEIGDWVLALGQPFGLESTVTAGIISAKHRAMGITDRENFLQTDAAINPGNSGGPLVNLNGEVIGINTAISSRSGGNQGIGFAVPANLAKWVSTHLVTNGVVQRAYLGVAIQTITQELADQFGVLPRQGVLISDVHRDTPAERAGLQAGDILLKFAGRPVRSAQSLQVMVEEARIGERHAMLVLRDGEQITLSMVAEEQPDSFGVVRASAPAEREAAPVAPQAAALGLQMETLTPEIAEQLKMPGVAGVVITQVEPGSAAAEAQLRPGMVITQVDHAKVTSVEQLRAALDEQALEQGVLLLVSTSKGSRFVVVESS